MGSKHPRSSYTLGPVLPVVPLTSFTGNKNVVILNAPLGAHLVSLCPSWTRVTGRSWFLQSASRLGCLRVLWGSARSPLCRRRHRVPAGWAESVSRCWRCCLGYSVVTVPAGSSNGQSLCFPLYQQVLGVGGWITKILFLIKFHLLMFARVDDLVLHQWEPVVVAR